MNDPDMLEAARRIIARQMLFKPPPRRLDPIRPIPAGKPPEPEPVQRPTRQKQAMPTNADEARAAALAYVRQGLDVGYTAEAAGREICLGYGAPGECGYNIAHGKITVPPVGEQKWIFEYAKLEAEIKAGQEQLLLL